MKVCFRTIAAALVLTGSCGFSQAPAAPAAGQAPEPAKGKVIFSRSADADGNVTTEAAATQTAAASPVATDAERLAVRFTAMALDVRLQPAAERLAVRAVMTVRNEGKTPLAHVPLQISSSLRWEEIRVAGRAAKFAEAAVNSDVDHTGQLREAAVTLAEPLAPGATVELDAVYSGTIAASAQRLTAIGTPPGVALHSDWDEISPAFTGLRGLGNVAWYPAASVPVLLGDGARLFDEIGRHRLTMEGCRFSLRLTAEFARDQAPTVAVVNGTAVPLTVTTPKGLDADVPGVATARLEPVEMGFEAPSLFLAVRTAHAAPVPAGAGLQPNVTAYTRAEDENNAPLWLDAAGRATPFLQRWLGPRPRTELTLLDLPEAEDAPWQSGALLCAGLTEPGAEMPADRLTGVLVHAMARTWAPKGPAWLAEGQATFLESMWVERQQGRERALQMLEADRAALALAEPASPGESTGTPLERATSPVYYRTKAGYVLWMLRDALGDDAMASTLAACDAAEHCDLETLAQKNAPGANVDWLFSDWVEADKGLPEMVTAGVFPTVAQAGSYLVAVDLTNTGYAAAMVPVTVRSNDGVVTERVLVPARGKATQRILSLSPPTAVQVNDGSVPETGASVHVTPITAAPAPPSTNGPVPHKLPRDKG